MFRVEQACEHGAGEIALGLDPPDAVVRIPERRARELQFECRVARTGRHPTRR
ncbi:hypothetical protein OKW30_000221 [Paraburkholderia sp. Clong3]|uniref:hypothetical protein n=1 Tax=Paraburkholderia sp. Clong3 TaxID=2991061 RepID=UPI003D19253A